jgi:multidrug resistance efflux pump
MNPSGKLPGINLNKLKAKTGAAPRAGAPGPTAAELAEVVMQRDRAQGLLNNAQLTIANLESSLRKAEAEIEHLKKPAKVSAASPEDVKKLEDVASAMNAAVDGIIKLIAETKVPDGSPAAQAIDTVILPALERLDTLLPRTN